MEAMRGLRLPRDSCEKGRHSGAAALMMRVQPVVVVMMVRLQPRAILRMRLSNWSGYFCVYFRVGGQGLLCT